MLFKDTRSGHNGTVGFQTGNNEGPGQGSIFAGFVSAVAGPGLNLRPLLVSCWADCGVHNKQHSCSGFEYKSGNEPGADITCTHEATASGIFTGKTGFSNFSG